MQKRLLLFLCFSILFIICNANAQKEQPMKSKSVSSPTSESITEVENISFDKTSATLWCPVDFVNEICKKDAQKIQITTSVKNPENKNLTYYYIVSGGKIIGQGANVTWDFADMPPGMYSITVGVGNNGIVHGNTITKTANIQECPVCDLPCICPTITVSKPTEASKPGDSIIFTAHVQGTDTKNFIYKWTISSGTIINGQGTPQIIIKTNPSMNNYSVIATIEIGGLCPTCYNTASETASISNNSN